MTGTVIAIGLIIIIMAVVGYALSHLSEPDSQAMNTSTDSAEPSASLSATQADSALLDEQGPDKQRLDKQRPDEQLIEEINRRLPQTQCAQCGHPGCRPYATAIINDNAPINQCPPGGDALIAELAAYLGTEVLPLDQQKGQTKAAQVAVIVEPDCIGCALCIAACPVDAIVGANRYMHTVIADQCTGCELCLPPCPVDCIELKPIETPLQRWQWPKPA